MGKLDDKVALITGSDSGIGRASAVEFAREGADVVVNYLEDEQGEGRGQADRLRWRTRRVDRVRVQQQRRDRPRWLVLAELPAGPPREALDRVVHGGLGQRNRARLAGESVPPVSEPIDASLPLGRPPGVPELAQRHRGALDGSLGRQLL